MKTLLILVGKTADKNFTAGINDYVQRINHYMPFDIITIPELKNTKKLTENQQKQLEGELIVKYIQTSDYVVLMDEHGKEYRSTDFAKWLVQKQNTARRLVFVIGGPYGFSQQIYDKANEMISLSKMTFSHQMVRLIFTEQLYRACTIIKGEPYHHE
ncbi:23S rRNA (pseudouridine(1915)-N(3))-methyltransferase RlmH [Xylanibacter rodentium]|jgi:23S rRNA (pseudouridine1915-N3)-methyltransferase|uniref:Ribosomal RNA large subunit methyltransferase H n=1 Tax=Xylanibacter rodentium TaxID=2736289 RepID=A0ABX2AUH2_9BACT|nr:23S rRNA (pseudouridine(1915)-N(3))-methyltransferase RlmH [Xylanibacter rodentium]NPE11018.1 23S rRNA (pseudouridine(1915)-N(3))-methyltransferase RlmH [Prevotella sp. PJ1A]NPE14134.1 23S rRNA (pseudouridine(1915)-N(3))-methyltransferase RlmH [Xylanibacter rodentium]NPE37440.1 23S rRNA (pseudouridine(1915)-N(3))-methyltransferase RlmH [Prevotella sp. PCJ2]